MIDFDTFWADVRRKAASGDNDWDRIARTQTVCLANRLDSIFVRRRKPDLGLVRGSAGSASDRRGNAVAAWLLVRNASAE
jgi:hypothetical protein